MKSQLSKLTDITLLAVACLTIMVGCVIVPGLPSIAVQLGVEAYASWLITIPSLGVVVFGPLASRFIQWLGLYKALCGGLFCYGLFGVAGLFLQGPLAVLIDRLLLGGATALVMSAGTGLISVFHEGQARLKMIAKQGMAIELGGVVFLFVGGLLATLSWQYPFLLYLVAWLFLVMVWLFVPNVEMLAAATNTATQPISFALKLVFAVALFSMVVFFAAIVMLPHVLHVRGWGEAEIGYLLSFVSLVAVVAAATMPKVIQRLGEYSTLCCGFLAYTISHAAFSVGGAMGMFVLGGVCLGIGFGLTVPLVNHMTIEQSHPIQRGRHLTYLAMAIFSGQFLASFMTIIPASESVTFLLIAAVAMFVGSLVLVVHIKHRKASVNTNR